MRTSTSGRIAAIVLLACPLALGIGTAASASPAAEAVHLAKMKSDWRELPKKTQKTICFAYREQPRRLIKESVAIAKADRSLTRKEWRRVIATYLDWACSGPGTTPR